MKKTRWFDPSVKPHRRGVYERKQSFETYPYSYWDGSCWRVSRQTPAGAFKCRNQERSVRQALAWRGLAEKP
jgi:hypothetical protein